MAVLLFMGIMTNGHGQNQGNLHQAIVHSQINVDAYVYGGLRLRGFLEKVELCIHGLHFVLFFSFFLFF